MYFLRAMDNISGIIINVSGRSYIWWERGDVFREMR